MNAPITRIIYSILSLPTTTPPKDKSQHLVDDVQAVMQDLKDYIAHYMELLNNRYNTTG